MDTVSSPSGFGVWGTCWSLDTNKAVDASFYILNPKWQTTYWLWTLASRPGLNNPTLSSANHLLSGFNFSPLLFFSTSRITRARGVVFEVSRVPHSSKDAGLNCQSSLNLYDNSRALLVLCLNEKDPLIALPPLPVSRLSSYTPKRQSRNAEQLLCHLFSLLPSSLSLLNLPPDNSHLSSSELWLKPIFSAIIDFGFLAPSGVTLLCNCALHFYTRLTIL